jgi:diphthamide synthase (EF-2-diphthine--ammonia ligase)
VLLEELPATVDPCGERGEFHTCVYDGPIFQQPLRLERGERVRRDGRFEYCDLTMEFPDGGNGYRVVSGDQSP